MSYIPDYRNEIDKLDDIDRSFMLGYRAAIEDGAAFFDNLDIYYEPADDDSGQEEKANFEDWMDMQETEMMCAVVESADYLDGEELVDANMPFKGQEGEER